ncbi:hypothetical protein ACWDXH_31665, partial [Micromonospora chokoriensis]
MSPAGLLVGDDGLVEDGLGGSVGEVGSGRSEAAAPDGVTTTGAAPVGAAVGAGPSAPVLGRVGTP